MTTRQRHQKKELEALMRLAETHGWTFDRKNGYFLGKCSCGVHMKTVHLSPSNPNYEKNLEHWLKRQSCWDEEGTDDRAAD